MVVSVEIVYLAFNRCASEFELQVLSDLDLCGDV